MINTNENSVFVPSSRRFTVPKGYELPGGSSSAGTIGTEFLSIPKNEIPKMVEKYIDALETGTTEEWCQCVWSLHPDDVDIQAGQCRDCKCMNTAHRVEYHGDITVSPCECGCVNFKGRRARRLNDEILCPVHSKKGLIIGFFEWMFGDEGKQDPVEEDLRTPNEWLDSPEYNNTIIRDCDGWTYGEWTKQIPITKMEFEKRLAKCTIDQKDAT